MASNPVPKRVLTPYWNYNPYFTERHSLPNSHYDPVGSAVVILEFLKLAAPNSSAFLQQNESTVHEPRGQAHHSHSPILQGHLSVLLFFCYNQMPAKKQHRGRGFIFIYTSRGFPSSWKERRRSRWWQECSAGLWSSSVEQQAVCRQEEGSLCKALMPVCRDSLPPSWLHLPKVPRPSETVQLAGVQAFKHMSLRGTFTI